MNTENSLIMYNDTNVYEDFNTEEETITKSIIVIINNLNVRIQNIQKKENETIKNICDIYINSEDICSFEINNNSNNIDFNDIINKEVNQTYNCDIINLLNILYKLHFYL
jgi:hypothetical protein